MSPGPTSLLRRLSTLKKSVKYETLHPPRLHDRTVLITGASSGLGRAIALQFASHGTRLIVCADLQPQPRKHGEESTSRSTVDVLNTLYGDKTAIFANLNVNNSEQVKRAVETAVLEGERLDILVNCAGVGNVSGSPLLHELEEHDWDHVVNVNLRGTYITNKFALQQMIKQKPKRLAGSCVNDEQSDDRQTSAMVERRGTIINVSSMLGSIALPDGTAAYCASKGGVLNLTKQLALDYSPYLININALCPGFLKSAMTAGNRKTLQARTLTEAGAFERDTPEQTGERMRCATPFGEWGQAADIARMAVSLASADGAWVSGAEIVVDGGYSAGGFGGVASARDPRYLRDRFQP